MNVWYIPGGGVPIAELYTPQIPYSRVLPAAHARARPNAGNRRSGPTHRRGRPPAPPRSPPNHRAPPRRQPERKITQPGQLRRVQSQPLAQPAQPARPEQRQAGQDRQSLADPAASPDRRTLRPRGPRSRPRQRPRRPLAGRLDLSRNRRRNRHHHQAPHRPSRQLRLPRHHGQHRGLAHDPGERTPSRRGHPRNHLRELPRQSQSSATPARKARASPHLEATGPHQGLGLRALLRHHAPGRQRSRPHPGHHRPRQPRPAAQARRLGSPPRMGLGSIAPHGLLRNQQGCRRAPRRH